MNETSGRYTTPCRQDNKAATATKYIMNSSTNPDTIKLFRVRKTVFKMLSKRGYAVSNEELNMPLERFLTDVFLLIFYDNSTVMQRVCQNQLT